MTGFLINVVQFFAPLIILGLVVWFVGPIILDALRVKQGEMRIKAATVMTKRAMERLRKRGM